MSEARAVIERIRKAQEWAESQEQAHRMGAEAGAKGYSASQGEAYLAISKVLDKIVHPDGE